jgi:hypothetical protein
MITELQLWHRGKPANLIGIVLRVALPGRLLFKIELLRDVPYLFLDASSVAS